MASLRYIKYFRKLLLCDYFFRLTFPPVMNEVTYLYKQVRLLALNKVMDL